MNEARLFKKLGTNENLKRIKAFYDERYLPTQDGFQWFLLILKLYWIFTKSSFENKARVNNLSVYRIMLCNI